MRCSEVFVKTGITFTFPPHSMLTKWQGIISQSLNIDPRGRGGSIIVLRSRSQEIASSTYSLLVVSLYFFQDCSQYGMPWLVISSI